VKDESGIIMDAFVGKGNLRELTLSLGIKYRLRNENAKYLWPFFSAGLYYSQTKYSGEYHGGLAGIHFTENKNTDKAGIMGCFGIEITFIKKLVVTSLATIRIGPAKIHDLENESQESSFIPGFVPIELGIAYRF
jgi:hypothetical protein